MTKPIVVETDRPIADLPMDVAQMCPVFTESGPFGAQIQNVLRASEGRELTAIRFTQHFLMHFFHPRYRAVEEIADNFEIPGCRTPDQIISEMRLLRRGVPAPVFCYPECEFDLWHHGDDANVQAAYTRVRRLLITRGVCPGEWEWRRDYAAWHRFSWKAYAAVIRRTLDALGWVNTIWYSSNVHSDESAWHADDYGNRVPAVDREPGRLDDLYVYPADDKGAGDGRAVNFAVRTGGFVHVAVGKTGGSVIAPEQVERRVSEVLKAGGRVNLFVGDPDAGQGASAMTCGQAAVRVCQTTA